MLQAVALTIAADYASYLPEVEVVEECVVFDAYLTDKQLVNVVGCCQFFFAPSVSSVALSSGSLVGML